MEWAIGPATVALPRAAGDGAGKTPGFPGAAPNAAWHHAGMSAIREPLSSLHRVPRASAAWRWALLAAHVVVALAWWQLGWRTGLVLLVATHLAFLWGALRPRSAMYGPVLSHLPVDDRRVWLTIDDGPSDDTPALLDLLDAHGAKATFFLVGERAEARPDLVREIAARGHGIGNHSHGHPQARFWALGPARMRREIVQCQDTLRAITGAAPRWFRAVVGHANPFVAAPLRECGLARVAWDARAFDAVRSDPAAVVAKLERELAPGAIVLLHEGARHGRNVEMIALLLQRMRALDYATLLPEELEPLA
jgi:peptidoglycan/xylan/chitin deacetylase (PgdA/CDA1 family)